MTKEKARKKELERRRQAFNEVVTALADNEGDME